MIKCFVDIAKRMGKEVRLISEEELAPENFEESKQLLDGIDLVVSMGADHAFLKS